MFKPAALVIFLLLFFVGQAQQVSLPADLRQHTLTQYNASLFNPAFSLDRNNPQSVSFWTRWQWQNVDADPTTLFLNYSRSLNEKSAVGIGFFQHNTSIYFNTGGALNYAYQIQFNRLISISLGANVFGFVQELADTRFPATPIPGIPQSTPTNDFILQVAPGFNLQVENFSLSLASENLIDYNFTDKLSNTAASDKIFMGMASYDFPVMASDSTAYIRPSVYLRTIPEQENQIGLNALFSTEKYWVQSGYNNFYGFSVGAGGTFFNRLSIGALVEFGANSSIRARNVALDPSNPTFEIIASYFLGKPEKRRPLVASGIIDEKQEVTLVEEELTDEKIREELEKAEKLSTKEDKKVEEVEETDEPILTDEEPEVLIQQDKNTKVDKKETRKLAAEQKALLKQQRKDSIAEIKKEKEALAVLKKQEIQAQKDVEKTQKLEAEKLEAEEAKKAEELAEAEKIKEQERIEEEQRKADEMKKAEALAQEQELKEEQRQEKLRKSKQEEAILEAQRIEQQRKLDSISEARKTAAELKLKEQKHQDSIVKAKKAEDIAKAMEQKRQDSIAKANAEKAIVAEKVAEESQQTEPEVVKPQAGEKYEEVANEEGLEPGYYLIANVFGTKKYFDAFMADLRGKGLQPKSFYRSRNKYNYAYLARYTTINDARQARDSKFNGQYSGKTWIFRVVGK